MKGGKATCLLEAKCEYLTFDQNKVTVNIHEYNVSLEGRDFKSLFCHHVVLLRQETSQYVMSLHLPQSHPRPSLTATMQKRGQ